MHNVTLSLSLENKSYQPGSYINGTIYLYVPPSAAGCGDYSGIHLTFKGVESVRTGRQHLDVPFVAMDTEVVSFAYNLISGQHEYSFYWKVPESLPCSLVCALEENPSWSSCGVRYSMIAYMKHNEQKGSNIKCDGSRSIKLEAPLSPMLCTGVDSRSGSKVHRKEDRIIFDPKTTTIRSRLRNKGTIDLGIDIIDQTIVLAGSNPTNLSIGITGRNLSSVPVDHLLIKLSETVEWSNGVFGLDASYHKQVLSEKVVMVDGIASWQLKPRRNMKQKKRVTPGIDRITVQLPCSNARDSFSGDFLRVSHSLQVIVVLKGRHVKNPKFKTHILLHRRPNKAITPTMTTEAQIEDMQQQTCVNHHGGEPVTPVNSLILGGVSHGDAIEIPEAVPLSVDPVCEFSDEECTDRHGSDEPEEKRHSETFLFARSDCGIDFSDLQHHPGAMQRHVSLSVPDMVMIVDEA